MEHTACTEIQKDLIFLHSISLFEGQFSIDWVVELTQKKASYVLLRLEKGVEEGLLAKKQPGIFYFPDLNERDRLRNFSPDEKQQIIHKILEILLRELPENSEKPQALAPYLLCLSVKNKENCQWLMTAADFYRKSFRTEEAIQCYLKVLDDLADCHGRELDLIFAKAAIQYSKISTARYQTTEVLNVLNEALNRAKRWEHTSHEALLKMHIAKNEWLRSQYSLALNHFQEGWSLAKKVDEPELIRSATVFGAFFLYWQGRYREAVHYYEKSVPDVEKYPQRTFPLFAALTVGHCYAQIGQVSQGLGMLDGIRTYCLQRGDYFLAANVDATMGMIMLDIGRPEDALPYLQSSLKAATSVHNQWICIIGKLMLAYAYYLKGENKKAVTALEEFLESSREVLVISPFSYLIELCWAMENGLLYRVSGISIQNEVSQALQNENISLKGIAYRFQALLDKKEGLPLEKIASSLNLSLKCLEESGHEIEIAKSRIELARVFLELGNQDKATEIFEPAWNFLYSYNEAFIPDDLKSLINNSAPDNDVFKKVLKVVREVVTIRDNKELFQHILSRANQITGAERGAIFLIDRQVNSKSQKIQLRASKNLTPNQIANPEFNKSLKIIEAVARTGKPQLNEKGSKGGTDTVDRNNVIQSCICVPMVLRDRIVGVLYHDNRLLSSAFRERDLDLLSFFAAQVAFAMENAQAYDEIQRLNKKLNEEKLYYEEQQLQSIHFEDIVGESTAIKKVLALVEQVASTETSILLLGETGVGKELIARAIHRHSPRKDKPFIRVLCSTFPDTLIPSELFGHEKGAFTGAISQRIGRFELADGGTLFLDEIGDLPFDVQMRMLRVLDSKEFERVGGHQTIHSDFRLVAATNRHLRQLVDAKKFREDLFYRLNVFPIYVPPLRERREDIPLLAHYFLQNYAVKTGKTFGRIPVTELDKLINYDWPGNVRELENIMERGVILSNGPSFRVPELSVHPAERSIEGDSFSLEENERRHITQALQKTRWKVRGEGGAAKLLKIHPSTLRFRIKKLGIRIPQKLSDRN